MRYFSFLVSGKTYDTQNSSRQQQQQQASGVQPPPQFNTNGVSSTSDSLDLGDLDLSRLRLTKQDLETLSNLTPALPKHFQDQLLAQLPPNQARKLSRTLSMQSNSQSAPVKVYKRSLSGGRDVDDANTATNPSNIIDSFDRSTVFRRSLSRTRDTESASRCDDLTNPPPSYRYACGDTSNTQQLPPPYKNYDTLPPRLAVSTSKDFIGRPPSGCLSPPPPVSPSDSPVRRRPSQRRISRFLRPDFFDTPQEDSVYVPHNDRSEREIDTQNVLREIRERSRDRATNDFKRERSAEPFSDRSYYSNLDAINNKERRKSSIPSARSVSDNPIKAAGILQNATIGDSTDPPTVRPKSNNLLTQPVNGLQNGFIDYNPSSNGTNKNFSDTILDELATLSNTKNTNSTAEDVCIDNIKRKDKLKVNKIKSKDSIDKLLKPDASITNEAVKETANNISMVTNLTNEIDSVTTLPKLNNETLKKVSKLVRPKSYPSKEQSPSEMPRKLSPERIEELNESIDANISTTERSTVMNNKNDDTKLARPKSYPASKIIKPKELKKVTNGVVPSAVPVTSTAQMEKSESPASETTNSVDEKSNGLKSTEKPTVVKKVKIVKKIVKVDGKTATKENSPQLKTVTQTAPVLESSQTATKEKSPEKKPRSGFLYSIGQKFEKLRENSKNKVKNSTSKVNVAPTETNTEPVIVVQRDMSSSKVIENSAPEITIKKTKFAVPKVADAQPSTLTTVNTKTACTVHKDVSILKEEIKSSERKSRIDAMIRNLRERSVPRGPVLTESGLIKRAVSVEDMTGAFNKRAVNRVLGLFKRIEKEHLEVPGSNVKNTKSSSTVDSLVYAASMERPKSSGFVSKLRKGRPYVGAISDTIISLTDQQHQHLLSANNTELAQTSVVDKLAKSYSKIPNTENQCLDCNDEGDALNVTKRHSNSEMKQSSEDKERMRNNRKGLVLDFTKLEKLETPPPDYKQATSGHYKNNNNNVSNNNNITANSISNNYDHKHYNINNNNNNDESINSEINANHMLTPSFDSMNYSSDSRSLIDDCASTSTFLSPTEEPELYFDDWSVCSEDNFGCASSSPSVSRMSRNSQGPSPLTKSNDSSESVIDRIKRRSFYCRFNVDKPKRQTNTVGTAARDYYREAAAKLKSRPADSISSTSAASTFDHSSSTKNTHEYYHPIKTSITSIHRSGNSHYQQPPTQLPPPHHHHHHHHHSHHHHSRSDDITSASVVTAKSLSSAGASSTRSMYDDDLRSYRPSEYMRTKSNYLPLPPSKSSSKITSPSHALDYRYTPTTDYLSMKTTNSNRGSGANSLAYDPLAPKYGTYNPKRRTSSYSSNAGGTGTGSAIDNNVTSSSNISSSYATLGRKARPYDHRSTSMMDSSTCNAANSPSTATVTSLYRRDSRTPTDFSTLTAR